MEAYDSVLFVYANIHFFSILQTISLMKVKMTWKEIRGERRAKVELGGFDGRAIGRIVLYERPLEGSCLIGIGMRQW